MKDHVYALAVIAHPDDEAFLLSGTLMKFAEENKTTAIVCATKGEKGTDRLNRDLSMEQMGQIRAEELKKSCSMIHCDCVELFDYPDGELDTMNFDKLANDIKSKIEYYTPEIILTFGLEGISGHRDHIIIGKASLKAAQESIHRPREIWLASIPGSIISQFNEHLQQRKVHHAHFQEKELQGVPDEKLLKVDIHKFSQTKQETLKVHESQYLPHLTFDIFLENECFEVIKLS